MDTSEMGIVPTMTPRFAKTASSTTASKHDDHDNFSPTPHNCQKTPRRYFFASALVTLIFLYGSSLAIFWLASPRLESLHPHLPEVTAIIILSSGLILLGSLALIAYGLLIQRTSPTMALLSRGMVFFSPLYEIGSSALGYGKSLFNLSRQRVLQQIQQYQPIRTTPPRCLCIAPANLPPQNLAVLTALCSEWNVDLMLIHHPDHDPSLFLRLQPQALLIIAHNRPQLPPSHQLGNPMPTRCLVLTETPFSPSAIQMLLADLLSQSEPSPSLAAASRHSR
jgi:hypothetical protein